MLPESLIHLVRSLQMGLDMKRRDREAYISQRAYELAASGYHISPITVVAALVEEGFPEAADFLGSNIIRNDLRAVCMQHWRGVRPDDFVALEQEIEAQQDDAGDPKPEQPR